MAPILITATPTEGVAPFDVTFTASAQPGFTISKMELDWNGDGIIDFTLQAEPWTIGLQQLAVSAGTAVIPSIVRVTDSTGAVRTATFPLTVMAPAVVDGRLRALWGGMTGALAAGDRTAALRYFSAPAQARFGPAFETLAAQLPAIVGSFSNPLAMQVQADLGEYAVNRIIDGVNRVYLVYFMREGDGVWRIEGM